MRYTGQIDWPSLSDGSHKDSVTCLKLHSQLMKHKDCHPGIIPGKGPQGLPMLYTLK